MILYHGTNTDIESIDLQLSRIGKDFGVGFYLTPEFDTAVKQAVRRTDINGGVPAVLTYEYDESKASSLKVLRFDGYSPQWAEFVRSNRDNRSRTQLHDYDIIVGPIANDDIGMQMRRFKARRIGMEEFLENIKYKKVTVQYFFGTLAAVELLKKVKINNL